MVATISSETRLPSETPGLSATYTVGTLPLISSTTGTTADLYGTKNLGLNYGALFTAWGVAGILGPMIAGSVFDATGSYRYAFYAAAGLALVAFASLLLAKPTVQVPESVVSMGGAQLKRA